MSFRIVSASVQEILKYQKDWIDDFLLIFMFYESLIIYLGHFFALDIEKIDFMISVFFFE